MADELPEKPPTQHIRPQGVPSESKVGLHTPEKDDEKDEQ